jgi:phospholipase/carboxylesterase
VPGSPFGFQWFGLAAWDPERVRRDPAFAAATRAKMLAGAEEVVDALHAFLDAELAGLNLAGDRLALVGFSQGTMMSLHVGPRRAAGCAAIVGYSGILIAPDKLAAEAKCKPPVLLVHGDADPVVPVSSLHDAVAGLGAAGFKVQWQSVPGLQHGIDPGGLQRGGRFLADAFAGKLSI